MPWLRPDFLAPPTQSTVISRDPPDGVTIRRVLGVSQPWASGPGLRLTVGPRGWISWPPTAGGATCALVKACLARRLAFGRTALECFTSPHKSAVKTRETQKHWHCRGRGNGCRPRPREAPRGTRSGPMRRVLFAKHYTLRKGDVASALSTNGLITARHPV
jgi:hypothetical protein